MDDMVEVCCARSSFNYKTNNMSFLLQGREYFAKTLSKIPDDLLLMAYSVKQAARNSITHRAALALAEVEEAELQKAYSSAMHAKQQERVAVTDEQLDLLGLLLDERGLSDVEDKGGYDRATYAKELNELMVAQMQAVQMEELMQSQGSLFRQDDDVLASTGLSHQDGGTASTSSSHDSDATSDEENIPF